MQLFHGDNLEKGFYTSTRAYITHDLYALVLVQTPFTKIVPKAKLDICELNFFVFKEIFFRKFCPYVKFVFKSGL